MSRPVFSHQSFLDFCKSKDPDEEYDYNSCSHCACAQYAKTLGMTFSQANAASFSFHGLNHIAGDFSSGPKDVFHVNFGYPRWDTFGNLVKRLEHAIAVNEAVDA